ncbi:MAG: hypothetical protein ACRDY0_05045 [Acidimicrobiales bacterium]
MSRRRRLGRLAWEVAHRPHLWAAAAALAVRMVPRQWWRRGLLPPPTYLEYRAEGVYGAPLTEVSPADFVGYLEWCRAFPGPIR